MTYPPFNPLDVPEARTLGGHLTVRNILRSYHSNYDLFAEAIQNALDAVHERWRDDNAYEPRLYVRIDLPRNTFTVIDNGVGMTPDVCRLAFAPNYSLKAALVADGRRLRGYKGVGATFLSYGFNQTQLASKKTAGEDAWTGQLEGARRWAEGLPGAAAPLVSPYEEKDETFNELDRGSLIRIRCDSDSSPAQLAAIASNKRTWEAILRTDTAIGKIARSNLDGTGAEDLVTTGLSNPRGIALVLVVTPVVTRSWGAVKSVFVPAE